MPLRRHRMSSADYRDAVLATNPAGYWRLGEPMGSTVARDEMGLHHGIYVGGPVLGAPGLLAGDADTAMTIAGTTRCVRLSGLSLTGRDFSLAGWVNPSSVAAGWHPLFGATTRGAIFGLNGAALKLSSSGVSDAPSATGFAATPGTTYFIGVSCSGTIVTYFVNGRLVSAHSPFVWGAGGLQTSLGDYDGDLWGGGVLAGTSDDPVAWARAISPGVFDDLYRIGMGR